MAGQYLGHECPSYRNRNLRLSGRNCAAWVGAEFISAELFDRQFLPDRYGPTVFTRLTDLPESRIRNYRNWLPLETGEKPLIVDCTGRSERTDQTCIRVSA